MFRGEVFTYLDDPIKFVEPNAEYSATAWGVQASFWSKAGGLSGKGRADSGNTYATTHPNLKVNIIEGVDATISRYNVAGESLLGCLFDAGRGFVVARPSGRWYPRSFGRLLVGPSAQTRGAGQILPYPHLLKGGL